MVFRCIHIVTILASSLVANSSLTLLRRLSNYFFFFFNDTATTEIYTLSLHDALPICNRPAEPCSSGRRHDCEFGPEDAPRSEEHTSELQSRPHLVCRLLLEKNIKVAISFIKNLPAFDHKYELSSAESG